MADKRCDVLLIEVLLGEKELSCAVAQTLNQVSVSLEGNPFKTRISENHEWNKDIFGYRNTLGTYLLI